MSNTTASIPESITVLGKTYSVAAGARGVGGKGDLGEADHSGLAIGYRADQAPMQLKDTILHECIHAIEYSLSLSFEERQVHALACGLLCLLRDNPKLVAFLTD